MKAVDLASKAKNVALNHKTLYIMGCFGSPMNSTNKKRYTNNHAYNKQAARKTKINAASTNTFGFDCVCLIKGLLWGWKGDVNKTYGGAVYKSNNTPDVGADTMYKSHCTNRSTDFSKIEIGELVWMPGHIGVYIGDGLAVECTPIWKDGVQITAVGNISKKAGYNTRTWSGHGKCKYLDYTKEKPTPAPVPKPTPTPTPAPVTGFKKGEIVVPTRLVNYTGTRLTQYDKTYVVYEDSRNDRVVLAAPRYGKLVVWAAMNIKDVRRV